MADQQLTYSFVVPLQLCSPLAELSGHAQHLAVACWRDERVAQHQRQQGRHNQQEVKARHDPWHLLLRQKAALCLFVSQPRMRVDGFQHTLCLLQNNYAAAGHWQPTTHCVRQARTSLHGTVTAGLRSQWAVMFQLRAAAPFTYSHIWYHDEDAPKSHTLLHVITAVKVKISHT